MKRTAPSDRLLLRLQLKLRIAADNFLGLGERPVGHFDLPTRKPDAGALRSGSKSSTPANGSGFDRLFAEYRHGVHELLGRWARFLSVLDQHHESHRHISFFILGNAGYLKAFTPEQLQVVSWESSDSLGRM